MKSQTYMDRALRASDPRYARILGKLGYGQRNMQAPIPAPVVDDISDLRAEYERVVGKRPFHGWDAATLRAKIAKVQEASRQGASDV